MIGALVIAFSLSLLILWFRYSCRLILGAKPAHDHTLEVAERNELQFLAVQQDLGVSGPGVELGVLQRKVERDYHLLNYLVHHSPAWRAGGELLEQRLMMLDFELMKAYCAIVSKFSRSAARRALQEMVAVVGYFANTLGERAETMPELIAPE